MSAKLRVLVVEDEALVAMLLEDMLSDLGHEVAATAGRLDHAEQLARELAIDLAVVDLNLNGQHTYPVATILAEGKVPFGFATGYGSAGLAPGWTHASALQKPFQLEELEAAIAGVLRA